MHTIESPAYRKAFIAYLRRGTPINTSLKAQAPTHYVWRTRADGKVRTSHAANNGKIFAWNDPPSTGHPGQDFNCRCWAEPYQAGKTEYVYQRLETFAEDAAYKWQPADFVLHAYLDGSDVTLQQIGHLKDIVEHYAYVVEGGIFQRVNTQIIAKARDRGFGYFPYTFDKSYDFEAVSYPHGEATVKGRFEGFVSREAEMLKIGGTVSYTFIDTYTDPVDIRQIINEISDPEMVSKIWRLVSDLGGRYYQLTGEWQTTYEANVKIHDSIY